MIFNHSHLSVLILIVSNATSSGYHSPVVSAIGIPIAMVWFVMSFCGVDKKPQV